MLKRYWIDFESSDIRMLTRLGLGLGAGVTAFSDDDAVSLLKNHLRVDVLPVIIKIRPNITFQDLEKDHVAKNLGNMAQRGVWFPQR
jgi:hypothetical protein